MDSVRGSKGWLLLILETTEIIAVLSMRFIARELAGRMCISRHLSWEGRYRGLHDSMHSVYRCIAWTCLHVYSSTFNLTMLV